MRLFDDPHPSIALVRQPSLLHLFVGRVESLGKMGRQPCCDKIGLKRGPWTIDEDQKLINFIINNGIQCWRLVPKLAGLMRCGKSCRLRWTNYLRPDLKRGALTEAEEDRIIQLHALLGNRWSKIASYFPGRTDNEIKNHWNTRIKKRMKLQGVDPVTHKPINEEHPRTCNLHERNAVESSPSKVEEKSEEIDLMNLVDACLQEFPTMDDDDDDDHKKRPSMTEVGFAGNMGVETNPNKNSCSTSFSLEEDALHEDSSTLLGWDDAFGGVSSWEALCHLEDVFPFCSYP